MKQIFEAGALTIVPCNRGFVFAEIHFDEEKGQKNVLTFNQHSFETGITTAISKGAYLSNIFLNHTEFLKGEIDDYINDIINFTPNFGMIMLTPDGLATVYDYNCKFKWKGSLKYKGYAPADAVVYGDSLWCSYPDSNTLIKYNVNSMRQEFKISSGISGKLKEPSGLFVAEDRLIITSANTGTIQALALDNYNLESIHNLFEPAIKYVKVDSNEVILTKTGIYQL